MLHCQISEIFSKRNKITVSEATKPHHMVPIQRSARLATERKLTLLRYLILETMTMHRLQANISQKKIRKTKSKME